ncbi:MAG TPA: LD-carboxypeptidase [Luteitalea sp.]|nr:LD-carboxypeptidase [Luteitalea sp.]
MTSRRPLLRPRALRRGDRVALLSLASPPRQADVEAGADELRALGFEPVIDDVAGGTSAPYVAGGAAERAALLRARLRDDTVAAIVATRGGYGSAHVLPWLDVDEIRATRKLLVGYSDITALLDVWTGAAGVVSIHGPMAEGRLARGPAGYDRDSFLRVTMEPTPLGVVAAPEARVLRRGHAVGVLRGGTLTQVAALLGTPWAFAAPEDTVLFLDDVNERPYRIDRMLLQLRQAGVLARVRGIVFNELPGCDEPDGGIGACEALLHALDDFDGPIVSGVPSGHTARPMLTLPLGVSATVSAGAQASLSIDEAAVE